MNKYKYKFSRIATVLLIAGMVLALACITLNVVRIANLAKDNIVASVYDVMSIIIAFLLSIFFIVFAVFALTNSYYIITDRGVSFKCGFISTKLDASEVKEIKFEAVKNKLEIVFNDETFFVVVIEAKSYEPFIVEFRSKFTKIPYIQISEPEK
ncbi:MAG: hypothetical protein IKV61_02790 [Clostridia bacterium]|nr:hypothetical protein [Clostridia bacterium]